MHKHMPKVTRIAVVLLFVLMSWSVFAGPLNINAADAAAIAQTMDGVGQSKAKAIVDYRKKHGDFKHIEDLAKVKGIGKKTVDKNRSKLTVGKASK